MRHPSTGPSSLAIASAALALTIGPVAPASAGGMRGGMTTTGHAMMPASRPIMMPHAPMMMRGGTGGMTMSHGYGTSQPSMPMHLPSSPSQHWSNPSVYALGGKHFGLSPEPSMPGGAKYGGGMMHGGMMQAGWSPAPAMYPSHPSQHMQNPAVYQLAGKHFALAPEGGWGGGMSTPGGGHAMGGSWGGPRPGTWHTSASWGTGGYGGGQDNGYGSGGSIMYGGHAGGKGWGAYQSTSYGGGSGGHEGGWSHGGSWSPHRVWAYSADAGRWGTSGGYGSSYGGGASSHNGHWDSQRVWAYSGDAGRWGTSGGHGSGGYATSSYGGSGCCGGSYGDGSYGGSSGYGWGRHHREAWDSSRQWDERWRHEHRRRDHHDWDYAAMTGGGTQGWGRSY